MKFKDKYPNVKQGDMVDNSYLIGNEGSCIICGEPTSFIEVCSEANFCSDECENQFYKELTEWQHKFENEEL
jgi:hypothetical protein